MNGKVQLVEYFEDSLSKEQISCKFLLTSLVEGICGIP